jgi:integrase
MRRGEILHQCLEDVDLTRKLLAVTRSKTAGGESREIPLTNRLLEILAKNPHEEGIVFTYQGHPLSWIRKGWLGALKRAKLRHFRFHDLRHTFNTRLMEAGVIQDVRMALMGHSGGSRVHAIYTHVELPVKREAIARLETWVQQQRKELEQQKHKEQENARTEKRTENDVGQPAVKQRQVGAQTVEEENTR